MNSRSCNGSNKIDKLKGKEKEHAQQLLSLLEKAENCVIDSWFDGRINVGHALDGVRCNGVLHRVTLSDFFKDINNNISNCESKIKQYQKAKKEFLIIKKYWENHFIICPFCKGKKGERDKYENPNWWDDCPECDGYGYKIKD